MYLESAAEGLQVCSSDEEPGGEGGNRTQVAPQRLWRNQLCLKVTDGTLCMPPAVQESRLPQTQHCLQAQGQPWTRKVTEIFVPPGTGLGAFSITWDIPKWHELTASDFSFHFPFYGTPEENCSLF